MKIFQQKFYCLLAMLLISALIYSQNGTFWFDYRSELVKRIYPVIDTTTTKEIVLFIATPPSVKPEHSIRIVDIGNKSFIEVRILERNLWDELSKLTKQNDSLSIKTYLFITPISGSFRNKMLMAFSNVIVLDENRIKPKNYQTVDGTIHGLQIFDGTTYEFVINKNGILSQSKIQYDLDSTDFRSRIAMTNLQIINDLKNNSFNEFKYDVFNQL